MLGKYMPWCASILCGNGGGGSSGTFAYSALLLPSSYNKWKTLFYRIKLIVLPFIYVRPIFEINVQYHVNVYSNINRLDHIEV